MTEEYPVVFTHVLDRIMAAADKALLPQQVFICNGIDVSDLQSIATPEVQGFTRCYRAEKLLKMYAQRLLFFNQMCVEVFGVVPDRDYDLPIFMFDWSESVDGIFFVCDFYPTDDPGRNPRYLHEYLYEPLDALYRKHCTIPGIAAPPLHWVRAVNSPYMIFARVDKEPRENIERLAECVLDYFIAWLGLWEKARPCDRSRPGMQLIDERRAVLRRLYLENDPGIGSINKFIGAEKGKRILELIVPE